MRLLVQVGGGLVRHLTLQEDLFLHSFDEAGAGVGVFEEEGFACVLTHGLCCHLFLDVFWQAFDVSIRLFILLKYLYFFLELLIHLLMTLL